MLSSLLNSSFALDIKHKIKMLEPINVPDDVAFFGENGEKYFLDQFENKTILLIFWATWCSTCITEMPDIDCLQKDFRKLPFEVIAVSQDFQGVQAVKDYFRQQEIRHLKIYHDYNNQLFKAFSVIGLPTSFLINQDGKMVTIFTGNINWHDNSIRNIILSNIDGNPVEPRNSYKPQSLNHIIKNPQNINLEQEEQPEQKEMLKKESKKESDEIEEDNNLPNKGSKDEKIK
jgi:thiol-disulfide isomerase/thioredoxin